MAATLRPGFANPERDAQRVFRALLAAMARPGRVTSLERTPAAMPRLGAAAAALLLALADAETPVWTDAGPAATDWLRFHAGCPIVSTPGHATFVHAAAAPPPLATLDRGTYAAPHRAATLLLEVSAIREGTGEGAGWTLTGPGIETLAWLAVDGAPAGWPDALAANHADYPAGVDVVLCAGDRIVALPRSTHVSAR